MINTGIYESIAKRTKGDIYIGVVGPVRTGKSTFIKGFMDEFVLPNIEDEVKRERAVDELPQSSAGRTIMTTEPKFIPEEAAEIKIGESMKLRVRMIDCVGYVVPSALGYIENEMPRMVKTPWFPQEVPFNMAAEVGTSKVITEHSTVGIVVTTDGSISDIPRDEYARAEERVIAELKDINKPFIVVLNSKYPESPECKALADTLKNKYSAGVVAVNCLEMSGEEIGKIFGELLYEFPIKEMLIDFPRWITALEREHEIRRKLYTAVSKASETLKKVKDSSDFQKEIEKSDLVVGCTVSDIELSAGSLKLKIDICDELFYKAITEKTGVEIKDDRQLMSQLTELSDIKKEWDRFRTALDEVEATGYGIVMPTMNELTLQDPEIMKQGGRYGVRLKASAPSIHMLKAEINTEVAPIVGTESQSEELIMYLLKEFEEDPSKIWQSNIFGKTLDSLVNEGLHNKLYRMPSDARMKLQETLERVINEGCSGLICIIL